MHRNPHQLIEGVLIAAYAAGATHAFIYIRGEYEEQADILDAALTEAYARGYVGERILGSDFACSLVVHRGAGAYICGEETALLDSLEGKRGNPRLKPPFPANQGLYQGPTLINNVETLCNVPAHHRQRRRLVQAVRDRALAGHEGRLGVRLRAAPRQLRDRAGHPVARDHLRPRGRPARRAAREGLVPGRLVGARADRGAPRPARTTSSTWPRPARCSARARSSSSTTRCRSCPSRCAWPSSTATNRAASACPAARARTGP